MLAIIFNHAQSLPASANPLGIARHSRSVGRLMGHNKGKDNVKKRKARRTKGERLQTAKDAAKASK